MTDKKNIFVFIIIILSIFSLSIGSVSAQCGDIQLLSLDKVPTRYYGGKTWTDMYRAYVSIQPVGDCLIASWSTTELNEELSEDEKATKPIYINFKVQNQHQKFRLEQRSGGLFIWDIIEVPSGYHSITLKGMKEDCLKIWSQYPGYSLVGYFNDAFTQTHCIFGEGRAVEHKIIGRLFSMDIMTSAFGKSTTLSINTDKETIKSDAVIGGDKFIFAQFSGFKIGTGEWVSEPSEIIMYDYLRAKWAAWSPTIQLTYKFSPTEVKNYYITSEYGDILSCLEENCGWFSCVGGFEQCKNAYDNKVNYYLQINDLSSKYKLPVGGEDYIIAQQTDSVIPDVLIETNAKAMGVEVVVGDPEVTCPSDTTTASGEQKKVTFYVKNIATGPGTFYLELRCNNEIEPLSRNTVGPIKAGETMAVTGTIGTESAGGIERECIFKARSTKPTSAGIFNSDECDFINKVNPGPQTCKSNYQQCISEEELKICKTGKLPQFITCTYGCDIEANQCKGSPDYVDCESCFSWLINEISPGHCKPQLAPKLLWVIPVGFSQDTICPYVLTGALIITLLLIFGFILLIIILIKKGKLGKPGEKMKEVFHI